MICSVLHFHFQKEVPKLKGHFGPIFRALHWCVDQAMNEALAEMDLTSSQGRILGYIVRRPQAPCARDIEEHFSLSHPSVSGTLSRLEKKGFIELRTDETDRRCRRIYLLPKGTTCTEQIAQRIQNIESRIIEGFTPEEQALFHSFALRALTNMGGTPCCRRHEEEPNP